MSRVKVKEPIQLSFDLCDPAPEKPTTNESKAVVYSFVDSRILAVRQAALERVAFAGIFTPPSIRLKG